MCKMVVSTIPNVLQRLLKGTEGSWIDVRYRIDEFIVHPFDPCIVMENFSST